MNVLNFNGVETFTRISVSFEATNNVRMKMSDNKIFRVKIILIFFTLLVTISKEEKKLKNVIDSAEFELLMRTKFTVYSYFTVDFCCFCFELLVSELVGNFAKL